MDAKSQESFFNLAQEIFPRARIRLREEDEVLLAYDGERLAGFLHLRPKTRSTYLQGMGVHPDYRHEGLGHALLEVAMGKTMARFGREGLSLKVRAENVEAVQLYLSAGFALDKYSETVWTLRWKPLN